MVTLECTPTTQFTVYPCGIDSSDQLPLAVDNVTPVKGEVVNRHREALIAIESELGIQPSGTYTTVRARLDALDQIIAGIIAGGSGGGINQILNNGVLVRQNVTSLDFIGAGVVATASGVDGRVDVTITSGGGSANQKQETLPVTVDGQTAFTLTQTPADSTAVEMFVNGLKQQYGVDYVCVGTAVTFTGVLTLLTTDIVEFWYLISGGGGGGGEDLAATLAIGNTTGGNDIILSIGDTLMSSAGTVVIDDDGQVTGDFEVIGKLTVGGLIDPTGLIMSEQAASPGFLPGSGTVWVRTDNTLVFTDETGQDFVVGGAQAIGNEIVFRLSGVYSGAVVPGFFDPPYPVTTARDIASVTLIRRTAGSSGTTRVDVLINGSSIFAVDGDKPQVIFSDGNNAIDTSVTFTTTALTVNDYLDIELETVEDGTPEGLCIVVRFV